jgi:hypothetical protein
LYSFRYVGKGKAVCYNKGAPKRRVARRQLQGFDGAGTVDLKEHQWWIEDELKVRHTHTSYFMVYTHPVHIETRLFGNDVLIM